jgi:hypothetical protein
MADVISCLSQYPSLLIFVPLKLSFPDSYSFLVFTHSQIGNPVKMFILEKPQRNIASIFLALPVCKGIYHLLITCHHVQRSGQHVLCNQDGRLWHDWCELLSDIVVKCESLNVCVWKACTCIYDARLHFFIGGYKLMHAVTPHFSSGTHTYAWPNLDHQSD